MDNQDENVDIIAVDDVLPSTSQSSFTSLCLSVATDTSPNELRDDEYSNLVRSLNIRQSEAYELVLKWCRDEVKSLTSERPKKS